MRTCCADPSMRSCMLWSAIYILILFIDYHYCLMRVIVMIKLFSCMRKMRHRCSCVWGNANISEK